MGRTHFKFKAQTISLALLTWSTSLLSGSKNFLSFNPKDSSYLYLLPSLLAQALVSFKKYMPLPLPYFKVNICPFPLLHFASIFFPYLWSFRWPNYIDTLPRYFSFRLPYSNIYTGPPRTNWTRIFSKSCFVYFSVIETDTATSGLRWIFHMHSEFSRPSMCNNVIMIISSQM